MVSRKVWRIARIVTDKHCSFFLFLNYSLLIVEYNTNSAWRHGYVEYVHTLLTKYISYSTLQYPLSMEFKDFLISTVSP